MQIKTAQEFTQKFLTETKKQSIISDPQANIYLIDKPKNIHSFRAVSVLRKVLDIKKVGFAGTLDPLASGLLIMATGRATRLLDLFHFLPKIYQADIIFGQISDTYDLEGQVVNNTDAEEFDKIFLKQQLKKFTGKQNQQAPMYSAKKVAGKKLHVLARQGKVVTPPSKEVEIYEIEMLDFNFPKLKIKVSCSAGTYIRSLAHDLGQATKQGALLSDLRRVAIGEFYIDQAIHLDKVDQEVLAKNAISAEQIISSLNQHFGL
ncbi:tRNA pseudouridine(55) synthase TruB [Candidatus Parcubacteria bacterium]|jgi:tRNA pseudouridine55 synthase|nr:tRNA pseudouridine(55) synthase TruB [Candidatus Parcubacteria bacterium]